MKGFISEFFRKYDRQFSKIERVVHYLTIAFPLLLALIILNTVYTLKQIKGFESQFDELFEIGLLFVVLTTVAAIFSAIATDVRISRLEKKLNDNKTIVKPKNNITKNEWLDKGSKIATIFGTVIAIGMLGFILQDVNSTQIQLANTEETTIALKKIAEQNNEQLDILNQAVTEIHHQTLVQAFVDGGKFKLGWYRCGGPSHTIELNGEESWSYIIAPVILDKDSDPTPIPFYTYVRLTYFGISDVQPYKRTLDSHNVNQYLLDPSDRRSFTLNPTKAFNEAIKQDISTVQLTLVGHSFAPFSPVKDKLLSEYTDDDNDYIMTEFRLLGESWDDFDIEDSLCGKAIDQ